MHSPATEENALRLQIIRKAQEEFFTHGFSKVTTGELATALGISKKTLYQHFESKEQLLRETVYLMRREIGGAVMAIAADPKLNFVEKLRGVMQTIGTKTGSIRRPYLDDIRRKMPDLWREIEAFRREKLLTTVSRLIEEGSRRGELRKDVDPEIFMMMFFTIIQHMMVPEVLAEIPFATATVFESFTTVMLTGVLTDEAREAYRAGTSSRESEDRESTA